MLVFDDSFSLEAAKNDETGRLKRSAFNLQVLYLADSALFPSLQSLRRLNHPNIIKLLEIVRQNNELFFIFEYMVTFGCTFSFDACLIFFQSCRFSASMYYSF